MFFAKINFVGVISILAEIRPINDLGNWLPNNLRNGEWILDYTARTLVKNIINQFLWSKRFLEYPLSLAYCFHICSLKMKSSTQKLAEWFENEAFSHLRGVPRYLIPRYFDAIISMVYCKLLDQVWYDFNLFWLCI